MADSNIKFLAKSLSSDVVSSVSSDSVAFILDNISVNEAPIPGPPGDLGPIGAQGDTGNIDSWLKLRDTPDTFYPNGLVTVNPFANGVLHDNPRSIISSTNIVFQSPGSYNHRQSIISSRAINGYLYGAGDSGKSNVIISSYFDANNVSSPLIKNSAYAAIIASKDSTINSYSDQIGTSAVFTSKDCNIYGNSKGNFIGNSFSDTIGINAASPVNSTLYDNVILGGNLRSLTSPNGHAGLNSIPDQAYQNTILISQRTSILAPTNPDSINRQNSIIHSRNIKISSANDQGDPVKNTITISSGATYSQTSPTFPYCYNNGNYSAIISSNNGCSIQGATGTYISKSTTIISSYKCEVNIQESSIVASKSSKIIHGESGNQHSMLIMSSYDCEISSTNSTNSNSIIGSNDSIIFGPDTTRAVQINTYSSEISLGERNTEIGGSYAYIEGTSGVIFGGRVNIISAGKYNHITGANNNRINSRIGYYGGTSGNYNTITASILCDISGAGGINGSRCTIIGCSQCGLRGDHDLATIIGSRLCYVTGTSSSHHTATIACSSNTGTTSAVYSATIGGAARNTTSYSVRVNSIVYDSSMMLSDINYKKNISKIRIEKNLLDDVIRTKIFLFHYNHQNDKESKQIGMIAQDVKQIFPDIVLDSEVVPENIYKKDQKYYRYSDDKEIIDEENINSARTKYFGKKDRKPITIDSSALNCLMWRTIQSLISLDLQLNEEVDQLLA